MTDLNPISQQPMSDDQELAKVLAGVSGDGDSAETTDTATVPGPDFPAAPPVAPFDPVSTDVPTIAPTPVMPDVPVVESTVPQEDTTLGTITPTSLPTPSLAPTGELDDIKKDALVELRPLVDKLSLAPDEKFDTYLLLLRSTDDKALIAPAHEAAKAITDETRRAQALLDIIKEIDYLSGQAPTA